MGRTAKHSTVTNLPRAVAKSYAHITFEKVRKAFTYCPESGELQLKEAKKQQAKRLTKDGYLILSAFRTNCLVHRLIWLYQTGAWPLYYIDHDNGNRTDNSWANLFDRTPSHNMLGYRGRAAGKSGAKNVVPGKVPGSWRGVFCWQGQDVYTPVRYSIAEVVADVSAKRAAFVATLPEGPKIVLETRP